jgi:predicted O-methyltransferase YrrM
MGVKRALLGCLPTSTNRLRRAALRFARETLASDMHWYLEQTPGCLNNEQGAMLYWLAAHPPARGTVVEIGSFMGRSTLWLAAGVQYAGIGRVVSIDPHAGHERPAIHVEHTDTFSAFLRHVEQAGLSGYVEPIREASARVAARWADPVDLLWIDGSHAYEDVLADLEGFAPQVVPGGHVVLHDTRGRRFPGVRRAARDFFSRARRFRRIANLRNMTAYRRG